MRLTTIIVASATISFAHAQTERDLDSHEHGHATLNIALDGSSAFIELESPWNNLVGFEHAPSTDEQHALVDDALALLNEPGRVFGFEGTECVVTETMVENNLADGDDHHDDEHAEKDHDEEHHEDAHDDEHAEKDHDEEHHEDTHDDEHAEKDHDEEHHEEAHDDEHAEKDHDDEHHEDAHDDKHSEDGHHDDHDAEGETHSSVLVSYSFECSDISKLNSIDVKLFETMTGFEELDVQMIGPGGQAAVELTEQNASVDVTPIL